MGGLGTKIFIRRPFVERTTKSAAFVPANQQYMSDTRHSGTDGPEKRHAPAELTAGLLSRSNRIGKIALRFTM
jgi:hypothetical protein